MMKSFEDKTVLITGASSGIGKAFAQKLAAKKANLILTARSETSLREIADNLKVTYGIEVNFFSLDLSQPESAKVLFRRVRESNLSVDVLINNAGFGSHGKFLDSKIENYSSMIGLNVNSLMELCYLFLPEMLEKNDGGI